MRHHSILVSSLAIAGIVVSCSAPGSDAEPDDDGGGSSPGGGSSKGGSNDPGAAGAGGSSSAEAGSGPSGGGSGDTSDSGAGGGVGDGGAGVGPGAPGWTAIPLLDDMTDPDSAVYRKDNDLVTGIYFASQDDGWVTTRSSNQTFGYGGAIYKATRTSLTSILFSGNRDGLCLGGSINFWGIDKSPDGYVALAYACDVIASHDGGDTFGIERNEAGSNLGVEHVYALRPRANETLMYADSGYLAKTSGAPGPQADWSTVWAPQAIPPTPDPVPADQCQRKQTNQQPEVRTVVYVSPDGEHIAYVSTSENDDPVVCVSKDAGVSFFPRELPDYPADAFNFSPRGVVFADDEVGIAFWANNLYPGSSYIYRTANGGDSWASVEVPAAVASKELEFYSAFFAPDGKNGWIVGYDYGSSLALLLRTQDAGLTWTKSGGDLAAKTANMGIPRLYSGFALDEYHLWVGGDYGILMANEAGGE